MVIAMPKKLYRINEGKMLCGVCTGIADYFTLDVSIVRLIFVLAGFAGGSGIIAYIAAAFIIPEKPYN
jgi:phage shock protein C